MSPKKFLKYKKLNPKLLLYNPISFPYYNILNSIKTHLKPYENSKRDCYQFQSKLRTLPNYFERNKIQNGIEDLKTVSRLTKL